GSHLGTSGYSRRINNSLIGRSREDKPLFYSLIPHSLTKKQQVVVSESPGYVDGNGRMRREPGPRWGLCPAYEVLFSAAIPTARRSLTDFSNQPSNGVCCT
ncbi:mCG145274, partial [Mus musculus]